MLTHFISWQESQLVSYDKTYLEQNKSRLMHSSFFLQGVHYIIFIIAATMIIIKT